MKPKEKVMRRRRLSSEAKRTALFFLLAIPVLLNLCLFGCDSQSGPKPLGSKPHNAAAPTRAEQEGSRVSTNELPDWPPAEADSGSLDAPYIISPFEIRPPASFRFIKYIKYMPETKAYYWVGPVRADDTYPQFIVMITEVTTSEASATLAALLSDAMGAIKQRRVDWSETPAEQGKINGLSFIRSSWSGTASSAAREGLAGRMMHGIVYLTVHDNQVIQIMCQDVAPDHPKWLELGGSAALTFRKLPDDNPSP